MNLGENLIEAGLATPSDIERALDRQKAEGGTLGQSLVALGIFSEEQLESFFRIPPPPIMTVADTGIRPVALMTLALKLMHVQGLETAGMVAPEIRLPAPIVVNLLKSAQERSLVESLGSGTAAMGGEVRFALTSRGKEWVNEALGRSEYVGPAPVPLEAYRRQVQRQRITNDRIDRDDLARSLSHLVIPESLIDRLGPAVNSGRTLLLYGTPGNGKTSIATAMARSFQQEIYVPHAIDVDGQTIKLFDPAVHQAIEPREPSEHAGAQGEHRPRLRLATEDKRWARCRRPVTVVGGELSLDMLELGFNVNAGFYEAPFHIKGNNGIFVIDDFGRQIDRPEKILNRWTLPLEQRTDYLTLNTGKKFAVRFDGLLIFSTNIPPGQIMDSAMMRRISYNFHIGAPSPEEFAEIFRGACTLNDLAYDPAIPQYLLDEVYRPRELPLARYHPRFIVEHVVARCRFQGLAAELTRDLVAEAVTHLYTAD